LDQFKAKGNAALQAGNHSQAIEYYSKAINLDGANHVYYSNRSAAYLSAGDANNALEDANACLGLNPDFSKGYSRKGAALHALKRYNDSIAAYEQGLAKFPDDAGLKKGLEQVKRDKDGPPPGSGRPGGGGLFSPQMMAQMALNPRLRKYLNDPELMEKVQMMQSNPNLMNNFLGDAKFMEFLSALAGGPDDEEDGNGSRAATGSSASSSATAAAARSGATPGAGPAASAKEEPEPEPEIEEDWSHLSEAERKVKESQKAALAKKEEGNSAYKLKKFDDALQAYDVAIALDPTNMTFLNNKAAVYFAQKRWKDCVDQCLAAVQVGKEHRAPFEDRAKAYTRAARAYQKLGDLGKAIDMCNEALLESYDKETNRLLKTLELEKKKADALAYQSDEKAEEAKQRGNDYFRAQKWSEAVNEYEEAVKRAPKNAAIRNNLAAALCKIMDFNGAQRQVEVALEIDPKYVKAWARLGDIQMVHKEYHKAMDSYKKGLEIDPENALCKEGLKKCVVTINLGRQNMTEAEKQEQQAHALADPEIQSILQDPVIQQILRDFGENPSAAQQALRDPGVRMKIEKLIAAGIIETR
jgi:stress-induced-phosphoprotein 1